MMGRLQSAGLIAALAVSAVLPYLLGLGYRAGDIEVIANSAAAAVLGLATGWAIGQSGRIYHLIVSFLVYWIADSYFVNSDKLIILALLAGLATFAALQSRFSINVQPMLIAFSVFWTASNLLSPPRELIHSALDTASPPRAGAASALPPLLHIILDEQMSPTALPETIPAGGHPATRIIPEYVNRGFEIHTKVRSVSHLTRHSLANLFSLRNDSENFLIAGGEFSLRIKDNSYLKLLQDKGYSVTVVQSNYLDICANHPGIDCHTYSRTGSGHAYANRGGHIAMRTKLAMFELHSYLHAAQRFGGVFAYGLVAAGLRKLGVPLHGSVYYSRPPAMLDVLDRISAMLDGVQPGRAYVIHMLLPHVPYVLGPDCSVNPAAEWTQRAGEDIVPNSAASIYPKYWDQAACTHSHMMRLLDRFTKSGIGAGAIIVVHGDHGARITLEDPAGQNQKDLLETIYAVRHPGSAGKIVDTEEILQSLFKETMVNLLAAPCPGAAIRPNCDTSSPRRSATLPNRGDREHRSIQARGRFTR